MKFKSLFDKLQPKQDSVRWLAPLRNRNGIKMNLKRVDISRTANPFEKTLQKLDQFSTSQTKPSTNYSPEKKPIIIPSLKQVDPDIISSRSSFQSERAEEIKLPPKSQWHQVKQDMKKDRSWLHYVLIGLSVIIFAGSGIFLYTSSRIDAKDKIISSCKDFVQSEGEKGFKANASNCDISLLPFEYIYADRKAQSNFDSIKSTIEKQQTEQKNQAKDIDQKTKLLKQELAQFSPDFESKIDPKLVKSETVSEKEQYLKALQEVGKTYDTEFGAKLSNLKQLVDLAGSEIDTKEEKSFIDSLAKKPKGEIYAAFPVLQTQINGLSEKFRAKYPQSWFEKILNNPELATFKSFTGDEIKNTLERAVYPETTSTQSVFPITGDQAADTKIIELAQARGYKMRPLAIEKSLIRSNGQLQQKAAKEAFEKLVQAAAQDGIRIGVVSGYRSPDEQKEIFLSRMRTVAGKTFTNEEIATGAANETINQVLETSSIPGYSRHHTGYAFDLTDVNSRKDFTRFAETEAYQWMSANNYFNAKRFGFLPSYPTGATNQGPEPEAWEYTFVGVEILKK
jgi:hypothetical protein